MLAASFALALAFAHAETPTLADDEARYFDQRAGWKALPASDWRVCPESLPDLGPWGGEPRTFEFEASNGIRWPALETKPFERKGFDRLDRTHRYLCLGGRWISLVGLELREALLSDDVKELVLQTSFPGESERWYWRLRASELASVEGLEATLQELAWLSAWLEEDGTVGPMTLDLRPSAGLGAESSAIALRLMEDEGRLRDASPFRAPKLRLAAAAWVGARTGADPVTVSIDPRRAKDAFGPATLIHIDLKERATVSELLKLRP